MKLRKQLTPKQVYDVFGHSTHEVISALVTAYQQDYALVTDNAYGAAGARITFAGYAPDTTEFNAATALYDVRW